MNHGIYTLTCSRAAETEQWNRSLQKLNGVAAFHTHEWSVFSSENNGYPAVYFLLCDQSGEVVAQSFGLIENRLHRKIPAFRTLSFGSLPAFKDQSTLNAMTLQLRRYAVRKGFMTIDWNSFGTPDACRFVDFLRDSTQKRWEFVVDLECGEDKLWEKLDGKKRGHIRSASKHGLRIEEAKSHQQILNYRGLSEETWKRKLQHGIPFPEPAPIDYFDKVKRRLIDPKRARMLLAFDGSRPVAGALFAAFHDSIYYVISAASEIGLKKSAPDLILWQAMTDYIREGYRWFNLGGVSEGELDGAPLESSGLYHFKKKFGADLHSCFKTCSVLHAKRYRLFRKMNSMKTHARTLLHKFI